MEKKLFKKRHLRMSCFFLLLIISCSSREIEPSFTFKENEQGIELLENGQYVFFYQKKPKLLNGQYVCCNYLHPLYSLNGDTLTEESPADHPHHRGIFWAWHQMSVNGKSLGDGWIMENIAQEVTNIRTTVDQSAKLNINAVWRSSLLGDKPFLSEQTTITVHQFQNGIRKIDFAISLTALVPGVEIGGSDDEKGYGGFCARIKHPGDLAFVSENKMVTPQLIQIEAGPWMDFSGSFGSEGETSGIAILCHPETPNYPEPWILRSKRSMQNVVFPGRNPVAIPIDRPVILYYLLIIHNGNASSIDLKKLQSEYEKMEVSNQNGN
ncbi:DUF6807 family protein [Mariniphaga sediminis]|nr:DUF6807 family protein [Mariniphaga sediminis]